MVLTKFRNHNRLAGAIAGRKVVLLFELLRRERVSRAWAARGVRVPFGHAPLVQSEDARYDSIERIRNLQHTFTSTNRSFAAHLIYPEFRFKGLVDCIRRASNLKGTPALCDFDHL